MLATVQRPSRALRAQVVDALVAAVALVDRALATVDTDPAAARGHAAAVMTSVARLVVHARDVVQSIDAGRGDAGGAVTADDVHDVLGHGLSLAAVLAGGAHAMLPADPTGARTMLARAAVVLAQAQDEVAVVLAERKTEQRHALDLALLVSWAIDAGEDVTLDADWVAVSTAPEPVIDVAHRVLQETLTNARKHAPGASVTVSARVARGWLLIDVTSARAASAGTDPRGRGLAVMARRARSLGGRVVVESGRSSFSVRAALPLAPLT